MIMSSVTAGLTTTSASAAGILPPGNPAANIAPDNGDWLTSINDTRTQEGVGSLNVVGIRAGGTVPSGAGVHGGE